MNRIKALTAQLEAYLKGLAIRERRLLYLAAAALAFAAVYYLAVVPQEQEVTALRATLTELDRRQQELEESLVAIATADEEDPKAPLRTRREALQREIARLREELDRTTRQQWVDEEFGSALQRILEARSTLNLIEFRREPPETAYANPDARIGIDRRPYAMEVEGPYLEVLAFLQRLEAMPQSWVWRELQLESREAGRTRVTLRMDELQTRGIEDAIRRLTD